jgi:hypothetical protein
MLKVSKVYRGPRGRGRCELCGRQFVGPQPVRGQAFCSDSHRVAISSTRYVLRTLRQRGVPLAAVLGPDFSGAA